jgi:hypothetical protein
MQKAIYYQFKEYCAEWYNPQRVTCKSPRSLEQVPKPHHFPSPRSRPGIVSAQTSTQKGGRCAASHAMSELGQNRKSSMGAYVFRFAPESGRRATWSARPFVPEADLMAPQQTASQFDYPSGASSRAKPFEG